MLSALHEEAGIDIDMSHLDFDPQTMLKFSRQHIRVINRERGLVSLPGAFFGQAVNEFLNVSGLPMSYLQ